MNTGQAGAFVVREERATIDGVEVANKTVRAVTDEGSVNIVATEIRTVETITSAPIIQQPAVLPVPLAPVPVIQPVLPEPVVIPSEKRNWVDICFKCDSEYEFYDLKGKGICWILILLLCYVVAGAIAIALAVTWIVCKCVAACLEKEEEEVYVVRRRRSSCAIS